MLTLAITLLENDIPTQQLDTSIDTDNSNAGDLRRTYFDIANNIIIDFASIRNIKTICEQNLNCLHDIRKMNNHSNVSVIVHVIVNAFMLQKFKLLRGSAVGFFDAIAVSSLPFS